VSSARIDWTLSAPDLPADGMLRGLPPMLGAAPRVLILGSMPGAASLTAQAYYAHPRNAFWPLLGELIGLDPTAPYADRLAALSAAGLALWDVIGACRRSGSLDSAIDADSVIVNDVAGLVRRAPTIHTVITNGGLAARLYRRHLAARLPTLTWHALPSTSPANARGGLTAKRQAWAPLTDALRPPC
jgi:hypoxanthine-DNA glycosylase